MEECVNVCNQASLVHLKVENLKNSSPKCEKISNYLLTTIGLHNMFYHQYPNVPISHRHIFGPALCK